MKILICSATEMEIKQIQSHFEFVKQNPLYPKLSHWKYHEIEIDILRSGIGLISTTYELTTVVYKENYNWIFNIGIAGVFSASSFQIGDVVQVVSEEIADLGIDTNKEFLTLFDESIENKNDFPYKEGALQNNFHFENIPIARAISSNTAHGRLSSIQDLEKRYPNRDIESMEGAAFFWVCLSTQKTKFAQIRSISNIIETRDKSKWNIPLALKNLDQTFIKILDKL